MSILYRIFLSIGTAFLLCAAPFGSTKANSLYTVEDIKVDVSDENAIKAREKAFEEAQVKAFKELTSRMLSEDEALNYETPPVSSISMLVKDYEVSDEKLSSKRYIGTYKFRFQERGVRRFFAKQGTQYTDVVSKPVLVLPLLETGQGTVVWSPQN